MLVYPKKNWMWVQKDFYLSPYVMGTSLEIENPYRPPTKRYQVLVGIKHKSEVKSTLELREQASN